MSIRRFRVVAATVSVCLTGASLAACSDSSTTGGGASSASGASGSCESATRQLKVGFIYASTTLNPFQEMAMGAKAAAEADGKVDLVSNAPNGIDPAKEVSLFQAAAQTATDGIAYQTVAPEPFGNALNDAAKRGINLVAVDAPAPPTAAESVPLFVGNSNTKLGELLGEALVKAKPPKGKIVLGNDIPSLQLLVQRLDGVQKVIKEKLPDNTVAGPFDSGNEKPVNYTKWSSIVKADSDLVAAISVGAAGGENLPLIKKQSGATFLAGSADISDESLANVKNGSLFALSSPEHWMKGYIAVNQLIKAKRSCSDLPKGWWDSGNLLIDSANVDAIITRQKDEASRTAGFKTEVDKQLATPPVRPLSEAN